MTEEQSIEPLRKNSEMQKNVVAIKSVNGSYFVIGKSESGYFLKNKFTEIPNEFNNYSLEDVKSLFDDLCERIPECIEVDFPHGGHPNSCMCVVYSDKTEQLFQEQKGVGMNLCAFTARTAYYSEYFVKISFSKKPVIYHWSPLITLDHLRWVCRDKTENYDVIYKAIKHFVEEDYVDIFESISPNGTIEIHEKVYGHDQGPMITITKDGKIGETGKFKFVELLKQHDVIVFRSNHN